MLGRYYVRILKNSITCKFKSVNTVLIKTERPYSPPVLDVNCLIVLLLLKVYDEGNWQC